jgi:Xaa-Pro dipeptidase
MDEINLAKFDEFLRRRGFEACLLSNPANITWLTEYAPSIQTGPSPFEGGPALGWVRQGELTLVMNDWESGAAIELGAKVNAYSGYDIHGPLIGIIKQGQALKEVIKEHISIKGKIAVELDFLPAAIYEVLKETLSGAQFTDISGELVPLRAIKSPKEIKKLRQAIRLSDIAQEEFVKNLRAGVTELELWGKVKNRVELEEGCRVPVLADLVCGERTAQVGGLPGEYILKPGDTVMLDFVARHKGYWGDNCAGYFIGEAHPELKKAAKVVLEALQRGQDALRPGVKAGDLDALVRGVIQESGYDPFPHHAGHGLGTTFHEEPRIIPGHNFTLEAGMVMALEPGIYLPGIGGIRLEDAYLISTDGCELLTHHLENYSLD